MNDKITASTVKAGNVEIKPREDRRGYMITVDGNEIQHCREFSIRFTAGDTPKVYLELLCFKPVEVSGEFAIEINETQVITAKEVE